MNQREKLEEATVKALRGKLNEGSEYYYKISYVLDAFENCIKNMNEARTEISKVQSNLEDETKIDALDGTSLYLEQTITAFQSVEEKLKKLFPEKLRSMTDEEKAEIDRMKANGEI